MAVKEVDRRLISQAERQVRAAETQLDNARTRLSERMALSVENGASYGDLAKLLTEFGRPISRQRAFQMVRGE